MDEMRKLNKDEMIKLFIEEFMKLNHIQKKSVLDYLKTLHNSQKIGN